MEQTYGCSRHSRQSGDLPLKNDLQAVCDSQHAGSWESFLLSRKERHSQSVCFQASILHEPFCWVLSCCSECLNSRVKAMCLPALFYPWKQIPSSFRYGSWGYCCGSVSESVGCHAVVTSSRWHSTANWPVAGSCEPPACFRNSKGWRRVKLALSQVWKQHSDGFSCSC